MKLCTLVTTLLLAAKPALATPNIAKASCKTPDATRCFGQIGIQMCQKKHWTTVQSCFNGKECQMSGCKLAAK
jgi:hypothetical protein